MSIKVFDLSELTDSSSLVTRQAARDLFAKISTTQEPEILLDFSRITFATRSFFDELNHLQSALKLLGKDVSFQNISNSLKPMVDVVKQTSQSRSSTVYASTANVTSLNI